MVVLGVEKNQTKKKLRYADCEHCNKMKMRKLKGFVGTYPNYWQVLSMIPKEDEGEKYEDAFARVRRCISGGTTAGNADDSDSDIELVADSVTVNLRCPVSCVWSKKVCVSSFCFLVWCLLLVVLADEWIEDEGCWEIQTMCTYGLFWSWSICFCQRTCSQGIFIIIFLHVYVCGHVYLSFL
jgi:hypothetical protein